MLRINELAKGIFPQCGNMKKKRKKKLEKFKIDTPITSLPPVKFKPCRSFWN